MTGLADVVLRFADDVGGDSPFYAGLARAAAADPDLMAMIEATPPGRHHPTLIFAAMHDIVLAGVEHPVADAYRAAKPGPAGERAFLDACRDLWPGLRERLMHRTTQTNEPNRSAVIRLALVALGDQPVGLVDVGASAGLNLMLDRYSYRYEPGARLAGAASSPVALECEVGSGDPAIDPDPVVAHRVGIDRAPVDPRDPEQTRWLRACLWPDQPERAARLAGALRVLAEDPPEIVQGDALAVLPDALAAVPDGVLPVVVTTWVLAYFPKPDRLAFVDLLAEASRRRPVAWVSCEAAGVVPVLPADAVPPGTTDSVLAAVRFHAGEANGEVLGLSHPHGRWVSWLAPPAT